MTASPTILLIRATQDSLQHYGFLHKQKRKQAQPAFLKIFFTVKSCILDFLKPIRVCLYILQPVYAKLLIYKECIITCTSS